MTPIDRGCRGTAACGDRGNARECARWSSRVENWMGRIVVAGLMALGAAPACAADVINGGQVYAKHCAACHGPNGVSVMPGAPHLARAERMMQPDLALLTTLKSGKNAMPAYIGILSDREIFDVIAFSRTLR